MQAPPVVDDVTLHDARNTVKRAAAILIVVLNIGIGLAAFVGCLAASRFESDSLIRAFIAAGIAFGIGVPMALLISLLMRRLVREADAASDEQQERIDIIGRHREFESKLGDALDMADSETEALLVIERTFAAVLPNGPAELLLADNSHAHLSRMAFTTPHGTAPGCAVASPQECPAARRARPHEFPDSNAINACPKLQGRTSGRCSALCIPVAVMGRTVGVIHTIGPVGELPSPAVITDLRAVANQAGARLGMLRVMAETQMQATTDTLTGLLNRRAFENSYVRSRGQAGVAAVAMADLDHFKQLNDTYGHETGDRALRTFAETLRACLRAEDLSCRRGGEEFAVFFPGCNAAAAVSALQRVQNKLRTSLQIAGLPAYTASFGVVEAEEYEELDAMLSRADAALFAAKKSGRDRITVFDADGQEVLYPVTAFASLEQDSTAVR